MKLEQEGILEEKKIVNIKSEGREHIPEWCHNRKCIIYNMAICNMAPSLVKLDARGRVMTVWTQRWTGGRSFVQQLGA